jgi:hypothetical protein
MQTPELRFINLIYYFGSYYFFFQFSRRVKILDDIKIVPAGLKTTLQDES